MTTTITNNSPSTLAPIEPALNINIRLATDRDDYDIKNIDALHKQNVDGLGYWPLGRLKGCIEQKRLLIAETIPPCCKDGQPMEGIRGSMLGFLVYTDKYSKREDVGCIYAVCVREIRQRGLIGAALVKDAFERMPYGVKLCCCWCAQDLDAGYFWEALGFVPLAYRTGSAKKERIHIFWQKRIRAEENQRNTGETPVPLTPYWYPSLTSGGAIGEGRLVLPMLPGMDWRDPKPMVLPEVPGVAMFKQLPGETVEDAEARCDAQDEKDAWKEKAKELREVMKLTPAQERASKEGRSWELTAEQEAAQEEYNTLQAKRRKHSGKNPRKMSSKKKATGNARREYSEKYLEGARAICAMWLDQLHAAGPDALPGSNSGGGGGKYECSRSLESAMAASGLSASMLLQANPLPTLTGGVDQAGDDIVDAQCTAVENDDDGDQTDELRDAA